MPLVRITLRKGLSADRVRHLADAVHQALVAQANVPPDDRFQVVDEVEPDRLFAHETYGGVERSKEVVFIEITLNAGRTLEVKRALYADLAARLERAAGIRPDDVLVSLVEVTKENWSFGGGRATYA
jgi:phenylpyruvate tautomerase PptA (4-oxalocrotonate tautomerase family)